MSTDQPRRLRAIVAAVGLAGLLTACAAFNDPGSGYQGKVSLPESFQTSVGTPLDIPFRAMLANDTNYPSVDVGFRVATAGTLGTVQVHDPHSLEGKVVYTPPPGFVGQDRFTYTYSCLLEVNCNYAQVTITVAPASSTTSSSTTSSTSSTSTSSTSSSTSTSSTTSSSTSLPPFPEF